MDNSQQQNKIPIGRTEIVSKKKVRNERIPFGRYNLALIIMVAFFGSCDAQNQSANMRPANEAVLQTEHNIKDNKEIRMETAVIGGGCFWCTEAQYLALEGVENVTSGYAGGSLKNPTYKQVCTGTTGHAEVIKIEYDADKISYAEILQAFFVAHDPTQLNRQGADEGTQYRSTIMPVNDTQQKIAQEIIKQFNEEQVYDQAVVTTIEPLDTFYPAEDYHQNYYANNGNSNPYCSRVVGPKLEKFKKVFKNKLKK